MADDSFWISYDMLNFTDDLFLQFQMSQQNETDQIEDDILHSSEPLRIFIITIYAIVIIMGFIENLLVVIVIVRHRHLHKVTNIFIASLAVSDIVLCVFNLPFQLHYQLTDFWVFGEILCRIIMPTFGVPIFYSTTCMMMIAVDRYILIVFPFKKRITKEMAILIISVIVFITFGLATPVMVHTRYDVINIPLFNIHKIFCYEKWPRFGALTYTFAIFFFQVLLPFGVTAILYFKIHRVLQQRPLKRSETRRNNRTNRILISIVGLFAVSWLPWNIFALIITLNHKTVYGPYFRLIDLILKIIAMSSACINPFLYGWLNDNFRKEFGIMLGKKIKQVRHNGYTNTYAEASRTCVVQDKLTTAL
ncbi:neuropeptide Y receptor type 6-like [Mizuhopecten yessoensis]|uniref:neuropeptide Y receptor type 6-like n=1 Tax=Mizuhopecten yessoensis TaxID=6573 RepID=UPI000B4576F5|nr:neuropeptide Y receptor type 6-like [Mizuhopecten yessoensis]XP_021378421.1 neuropeptide Y receptor type 6-like [Mizuhopecten yessoensis]